MRMVGAEIGGRRPDFIIIIIIGWAKIKIRMTTMWRRDG